MNRMRVALVQKILPISALAFLLLCTPLHLAAQESPAADQVTVVEWFSALWSDLTAWLDDEYVSIPTHPEQPSDSWNENTCAIDPNGGCGG